MLHEKEERLPKPKLLMTIAVMVALAAFVTAALPGAAVAASGALDPTFGSGGEVTTDFAGFFDEAHAVLVQPDGKVVAAGFTDGSVEDFALTRYNADGSLDSSFGIGGKVQTDFPGDFGFANAVALQGDGKIVAGGGRFFGGGVLVRYNADGSIDAGFGSGGESSVGFTYAVQSLAAQPDGKIVATGPAPSAAIVDFGVARFNADGSPDTSFGTSGQVLTDFAGGDDEPLSVALQPDGKIVAAGSTGTGAPGTSFDFGLVRYTADGALDSSFGVGGKVVTDFAGNTTDDHAAAIAIQSDGKIVAAGDASPIGGSPTGRDFALARYNADGSLDGSFGSGGKATTDFAISDDRAFALALQTDGKLVAAGFSGAFAFPPVHDFALARYNADGSLDTGFGSGGKVTTDFAGGNDQADGVAIQADGKIVAAGFTATTGGDENFALARYLDGSPAPVTVTIDIKPGSSTNPIKLSGGGLIPVAILTTDSFDATTVDPRTVCFGDDDNPSQRDCAAINGGHIEDVNGDGRPDLLLQYKVSQTGIDAGDTTACLTGETFTGVSIEGCDSIRTI